jgi:hypothetical protein
MGSSRKVAASSCSTTVEVMVGQQQRVHEVLAANRQLVGAMLSCHIQQSGRPLLLAMILQWPAAATEALALDIRILHCGRLCLHLPATAGQR